MTRTTSIISLVLATLAAAVAAAPAAASDGSGSRDGIVAGQSSSPTSGTGQLSGGRTAGERSVLKAYSALPSSQPPSGAGQLSGGRTAGERSVRRAYSALPSSQPTSGAGQLSGGRTAGERSVRRAYSALPSVHTVEVRASEGFNWGDALIGALIASGLLLVGLAGALTVVRHQRTAAESRA
jgi:hypothetical protein